MTLFFTTLLLTVPLFVGAALLINVCRRRAARTRHGLTGMCHERGGEMCGCCAAALQQRIGRMDD